MVRPECEPVLSLTFLIPLVMMQAAQARHHSMRVTATSTAVCSAAVPDEEEDGGGLALHGPACEKEMPQGLEHSNSASGYKVNIIRS